MHRLFISDCYFLYIKHDHLFKFVVVVLMATAFIDEASANICPRWVKLNKSPIFFRAVSNQYGRFTYPQNIFVSSFMFVHRTGSVSCNKKKNYSNWGCTPNTSDLSVVLTDHQNRILAPAGSKVYKYGWYTLAGYTSSSSVLVFCVTKNPHCIFANTELRLWYGEDLRDTGDSDNGGKACVDVYGLLA